MPLTKGQPVGKSISELIDSYRSKGSIGNSKPKTMEQAKKQAIAIAYKIRGQK